MRKRSMTKRLLAFLLVGAMAFGELGGMQVSAQEPVDISEEGKAALQGEILQDPSVVEENETAAQNPEGDNPEDKAPEGESKAPEEESKEPEEEGKAPEGESGAPEEESKEPDIEKEQPEEIQPEKEGEAAPAPMEDSVIESQETSAVYKEAMQTLSAPENLRVDNVFWWDRHVKLLWAYNAEQNDERYSFEIYRSETEDGEYTKMFANVYPEWDKNHMFYAEVEADLNPETGNAKKYYYKVKAIYTEGENRVESDFSAIAENEEIAWGSGMGTDYKSLCFLDNTGEPIQSLELHAGETKKLGLGLIKEDGTIVPMKSIKSQIQAYEKKMTGLSFREWRAGFIDDFDEGFFGQEQQTDDGNYADVEFSMEDDVLYGYEQYVTANRLLGDKDGHYFLEAEAQADPVFGHYKLHIPVKILEAEEGASYEKGFEPAHICTTKEEFYAQAREIQRNRGKGVVLVEDGVFNQSSIYEMLDPHEIYDTYAERSGMKPDEGDYIFYHIGDLSKKAGEIVAIDDYQYGQMNLGGVSYNVYTFSGPYLTTRAQEDRVDAKIKELLSPGGALYAAASMDEAQKAEAIAGFVNGHVSYIGTRDPQYHTCYSALIDKKGTCEAYSLLFMRLAREMGLASKMVGTTMDASGNCHDFNIVKVNGKWYHIDALGDCKLHTGRPGATLADVYLDQRFINNYLSRIEGSGYQYVSSGTVTIEDDLGEKTDFTSFSAAKKYVESLAAQEGNEERTYRVLISKDMEPDGMYALCFGGVSDRVTVDLCGHTLKIRDMAHVEIQAARVTNGKITVGTEGSVYLCSLKGGKESVYDNLSISWKQTTSYIEYEGNRWCVWSGYENGGNQESQEAQNPDEGNFGSVRLEKTVKIGSNCYDLSLSNTEAEGDLAAKNMMIFQNVTAHGNVTAQKLDIGGKNIVLEGAVKATERLNCSEDITVIGDWTSSKQSGFEGGVNITVKGSLSLSGTTSAFRTQDLGDWSYSGPATITIDRRYDEQGRLLSQGQISVSGSLKLPKEVEPWAGEERTIFDIKPIDYIEDTQQENSAFHTGDQIAKLSIQKILDGNGRNLGALNSTNLADYIKCGPIDSEKGASLELDETTLLVASDCVRVSYGEGEAVKTATYSSLKNAVAGLDSLANKGKGVYTFTFVDNGRLTKDLTLPDYVTYACLEAESEGGCRLDFAGYTLSAAGDMTVDDSLYLLSSGNKAGTIKLTKNNAKAAAFTFCINKAGSQTLMRKVNITAANTSVTLSTDTESTGVLALESTITANTVYVKSGSWSISQASLGTLQIGRESSLEISALSSVTNLAVEENAKFLTDSMTQGSKGKTLLAPGSVVVVKKKAVLYNPVLTAGEEDACIYMAQEADLEIQGKLARDTEEAFLSLGILGSAGAVQESKIQCADFTKETKLFSTKISNFPIEALHIRQASEDSASIYKLAYQIGESVYAGAEWFAVFARGVDGKETKLAGFTKWSETAAYLNTLSNASMTYIVEILEDVDTRGPLTMPARAKEVIFRAAKSNTTGFETEAVTLTAAGDMKLSSDTTFEYVNLDIKKYDKKTKTNIPAAVNLNGKNLTFIGSNAEFASITGTNTSSLTARIALSRGVRRSNIKVTGAVTKLGRLSLSGAFLTAGSSVEVTDTLSMMSSTLESDSKINIKNLVSYSEDNRITYGGNDRGNILTITGTVTTSDELDLNLEMQIDGQDAIIRPAAIFLNPKAAKADKDGEILLCNAAKAGAGWFVMGDASKGTFNGVESVAYKSGNGIYKGGTLKAVRLMHLNVWGKYSFDSSFDTLQEALSEIDRMADAEQSYKIEVYTAQSKNVTAPEKNLTFPSRVKKVTVAFMSSGTSDEDTLGSMYYNNKLELKSDLELVNAMLSPRTKATIALGKYSLTLDHCEVDANTGISSITGSGVGASSELVLKETDIIVQGDIDKIGTVRLANTALEAWGAVNVGNVSVTDAEGNASAVIAALAKVTRDRDGNVTKVEPRITIQGKVECSGAGRLGVALLEKSGTEYKSMIFDEKAKNILTQGVKIVKAPQANGALVEPMNDGLRADGGGAARSLLKVNGYLTCYGDGMYGAILRYMENGSEKKIPCRTFSDAVGEINNYKVKRAYTIEITPDALAIADQAPAVAPKALTMPNKNYIASLLITGTAGEEETTSLPYTGNITLTCNTTLRDVSFKQRVKTNGIYQDAASAAGAAAVSAGGFAIDIEGKVDFNTPLTLNGGNKGILTLAENSRLQTLTNGYSGEGEKKSVLYGTIGGFAKVTIKNQILELREYRKNSTEQNPSRAASLGTAELELLGGGFTLTGEYTKGAVTIKNLTLDSTSGVASVKAGGKLNLTNVRLMGNNSITIQADQDFTISGSLDNKVLDVTLLTRLRGAGKTPYLTVNGNVETEQPIKVGVLAAAGSADSEGFVKLADAPRATGQLLTAKTAPASAFRPKDENYSGGSGEYSFDNPTGYMVMKTGTGIYVYDGSKVRIALCKGDYFWDNSKEKPLWNNLRLAKTNGDLLGYYTDFETASAAVDALKDARASYTLILTNHVGEGTSPATVKLPSKAGKVYVTGFTDDGNAITSDRKAIVFSGNISLKSPTVFGDVAFVPVVKKGKSFYGTSFSIAAGGCDLTLHGVSIGIPGESGELLKGVEDTAAMSLKDISGNGKQEVTLDTLDLKLSGGISNANVLTVMRDAEIKGNIKASVLKLYKRQSYEDEVHVTLTAKGAVTLDTLRTENAENVLIYTRTAKDAPNLTINKTIEKNENGRLILNMVSDKDTSDYLLKRKGNTVALSDNLKLAVMPQEGTMAYTLQINDEIIPTDGTRGTLVKADRGIYLADSSLSEFLALIQDDAQYGAVCLDYQQAVNEINNRSAADTDYSITFLGTEVTDTSLTDKNPCSGFALPGKDKASSVTLAGVLSCKVSFTGDISGTGTVALSGLNLNPVNGKGEPKAFKITVKKDSKTAVLYLGNVQIADNTPASAGLLNQIAGTKNVTTVQIENSALTLKTGFSNIGELILGNENDHAVKTKIVTGGSSVIGNLKLIGDSAFIALGKTTVENIDVREALQEGNTGYAYIGTRLEKGKPTFTLNGLTKVGEGSERKVICKVYTEDSTISNPLEVQEYTGQADDVPLIVAKKAFAGDFVAARYAFLTSGCSASDHMTKENLVAYKDGDYVKNGNKNNMAVHIREYEDEDCARQVSESYARSFDEAVTAVNSRADTTAYYRLTLLEREGVDRQIKTTKKGTAFGGLTLPSKAAGITIESENSSAAAGPWAVLMYTGALKASCDVTFSNILLTEGTVKKGVFAPSYQITPAPGTNASICFKSTAKTLAEGEEVTGADTLVLASASGNRGGLELYHTAAKVKGAVNLASLTLRQGSRVEAEGKVTVTALYAEVPVNEDNRPDNILSSSQTMAVVNIYGADERGGMAGLETCFTKTKKEGEYGNTQLTISGEIENVKVWLGMKVYDPAPSVKEYKDLSDVSPLVIKGTEKPKPYQKFASVPKAGLENLIITGMGSCVPFKYEGGVYLTDHQPLVRVTGSRETEHTDHLVYKADFLQWEQAVKEIDRIANANNRYTIELLETLGVKEGEIIPISTVTLPTKAKEVLVRAEGTEGEERGIFFTGATITLKCPVTMEGIGLMRVKKNSKTRLYDTVDVYTVNTGNFAFTLKDPAAALNGMEAKAGNITGSARGSYTFQSGSENSLMAPALKITNVGTVTLQTLPGEDAAEAQLSVESGMSGINMLRVGPGVRLKIRAAVSVKNLVLDSSALEAKDITVSTLAELMNGSELKSGTKTVGDGRLILNNIEIRGGGNTLLAKQDKNGNSLLAVNGTIMNKSGNDSCSIRVGLCYNDQSGFAQLYDGMALGNVKNTGVNAEWFIPYYTTGNSSDAAAGMGFETEAYGVYKNKNILYYGRLQGNGGRWLEP